MIKWFKVFGWVCLVIGAIASGVVFFSVLESNHAIEEASLLYPYDDANLGEKTPVIISIVPFLVMGFQACFFFAISEGLSYLKRGNDIQTDLEVEVRGLRKHIESQENKTA